MYFYIAILLCSVFYTQAAVLLRDSSRHYYTLHFPLGHTDASTVQHAKVIAQAIGTHYEGQVGELKTYHLVSSPVDKKRTSVDPVLARFEQQKHASSNKRQHLPWSQVQRIDKQVWRQRSKREVSVSLLKEAQTSLNIHDPGFIKQWHLINQEHQGHDINVTSVWKQGITGNGTIVALLDDGLDYKSKDLVDNFYAQGSYDFNDHVDLPTPVLWNDYHGTRCAGQIAAAKNDACGVGIAYDAKVSGIRILSGEITDADEAAALNYKYHENHIFSCSWGPTDDGKTMEAPTGILADAFINGVEHGRDGKGTIYVFATGNGGDAGDNCNFDGYTNSIYTITIGALDHTDHHPSYSERCSAQLAVTYSSGGGKSIYTTNHGNEACTNIHGGTSAAAPNAAGIFALVLSVRPDLTWRDMQHLCVQTALPIDKNDTDWKQLPSGRQFSHSYGYGKLDTWAIIEAAKTFRNVNNQTYLELPVKMNKTAIPDTTDQKHKKPLQSRIQITQDMIEAAGLSRLEHVTATVNIEHQRRGDIQIILSSPSNVESELAAVRPGDTSSHGIRNWKFMTVKHWEENPIGNWTLLVYDETNADAKGYMLNWTLTLFGEMDRGFDRDPIHRPDVDHDTTNNSTTLVLKPTSSATPTSSKDSPVPARPTRVKPATTLNAESSPDNSNAAPTLYLDTDYVEPGGSSSTDDSPDHSILVYAFIGSALLLGLGTALYIFKRKHWRSTALTRQYSTEYEFNELKPEEDEEDDDASDGRPLLA